MRILVVGGGAREDALSWRLAASPSCDALFHAPGNAGTASRGENWSDVAATDARTLVRRAQEARIDLVVLGPETAIAAGVGDKLRDAGIAVFGPNRGGGRLETSKVFAKRFMERHGIPSARFRVVHNLDQARRALEAWSGAAVVKADGLAAGKGVVVCDGAADALTVLTGWYTGNAIPGGGQDVVIEQRLAGREVSVFAIADGRAMVPIAAACDYKRAGDDDKGPNTGGMGAYSPPALFGDDLLDVVRERVVAPALRGLLAEGEEYRGVLYCGLMMTDDGPYVIEFNARFGDPETQVLVPRVNGDFARYLKSAADGALEIDAATWSDDACVGVVLATSRYPYENTPVRGLPAELGLAGDVVAFWGTSSREDDGTVTSPGGRVLTVAARGANVGVARAHAYAAIDGLKARFPSGTPLAYRSDIARLP
ncbi:phosphoribosylamine--glycine ligase [Vulcanimicrobium alpinum]|uniref:Phosphoribosylamine--glycine ligase n=1 Tax=Vulcanimicrobium alpinum TaxID=3016050 RepID=A0AAN2C9G6_UNVUL|nr:phosphoribosylamine--glycine ligase [Vulcanimicrobium alpinum]BDE05968.1 phosphoribosylamine--glycine ligase [Vulcanimicrobium alpinum]